MKERLEQKSLWVRNQILERIVFTRKGHIGGAFSCTDILVALYYGGIFRFDPKDPAWEKRDKFILSKGHSCIALYPILADLGFFSFSQWDNYCQNGCLLGGHPDRNIPGIEAVTGSLGHGLGIGAGLALSAKLDGSDCMSVVLLGDGECYEGSVWEAAMFAGHHKLNNLIVIIDRNKQCVTDFTEDCNQLEPLADKWKAFGWDACVVDGHSFDELLAVFRGFRRRKSLRPLAIVAQTTKGKGVSFMEGKISWHHGVPAGEDLKLARQELREDKYKVLSQ
jgi:transketolase